MSHDATVKVAGRLADITITKADGSTVRLGRPGTLRFRLRRALYIFNLKRKGLI